MEAILSSNFLLETGDNVFELVKAELFEKHLRLEMDDGDNYDMIVNPFITVETLPSTVIPASSNALIKLAEDLSGGEIGDETVLYGVEINSVGEAVVLMCMDQSILARWVIFLKEAVSSVTQKLLKLHKDCVLRMPESAESRPEIMNLAFTAKVLTETIKGPPVWSCRLMLTDIHGSKVQSWPAGSGGVKIEPLMGNSLCIVVADSEVLATYDETRSNLWLTHSDISFEDLSVSKNPLRSVADRESKRMSLFKRQSNSAPESSPDGPPSRNSSSKLRDSVRQSWHRNSVRFNV